MSALCPDCGQDWSKHGSACIPQNPILQLGVSSEVLREYLILVVEKLESIDEHLIQILKPKSEQMKSYSR